MDKQKFESRSGCLDFGTDYEYLMSAYYGLKLSVNPRCASFKLSTNNDEMGNFDDVVMELVLTSGEELLVALQLKHHKENNLTIDSFIKPSGDHSLEKYCKGYHDIRSKYKHPTITFDKCRFILFTNAFIPVKNFETYNKVEKQKVLADEIQMKKSGIFITKYDKCVADTLVNVTNAKEYFIYKFRNDENKKVLDEDFLAQFFLYSRQENAQNIEMIISASIQNLFKNQDPNVVVNYINFFKYWCRGSLSNVKLTKKDVSLKLAEYLLAPKIPEIDIGNVNKKYYGPKSDLLEEILNDFDLVLVDDENQDSTEVEEKIFAAILRKFPKFFELDSWSRPLESEVETKLLPEDIPVPTSAQGQDFIEQSLKKIYTTLWHMGLVPMVIKVNRTAKDNVLETLSTLCENLEERKKFVIIGGGFTKEDFSADRWKVCENLSDLTQTLYERVTNEFSVCPQNRQSISLKKFLGDDTCIKQLAIGHLLQILNNDFGVGVDVRGILPKHYITRSISKILIDPHAINGIKNDIFVISCNSHYEEMKNYLINSVELNKYLLMCQESLNAKDFNIKQVPINQALNQNSKIEDSFVMFTENICSKEEFELISSLRQEKSCHHLVINDNKKFEWTDTKGKIDNLKQYQTEVTIDQEENFIKDQEVFEYFENNLNIVSADPGIGKSVLFQFLQKTCPPTHWVIKINLNDNVKFFKEEHTKDDVLSHLLKSETNTKLEEEFLIILAAQKNILFLWDGFDELPEVCAKSVISAIKFFRDDDYPQWISARKNSKNFLENTFGVFSLSIMPYTGDDQYQYVYNSLSETFGEIDNIVDEINENISNSLTCGLFDYSGNPLHIYMICETFRKNPEKYLEEFKIVTLTDIYQGYIEGKFEDYFQKADLVKPNSYMKKIQKIVQDSMMVKYQICALKASFDEDLFKSMVIAEGDKDLQDVIQKKDKLGIILGVTDDQKPVFAHKTYEEFLTAFWLSQNYSDHPNMLKIIFQDDYVNIRLMFDMILAKDCPLHLAVLYKNLKVVQNYQDEASQSEDRGGRNALHIACSWGQKQVLLQNNEVDNDNIKEPDSDSFRTIIEILLDKKCDVHSKDNLLNLTPFGYSQLTLSLTVVEILFSQQELPSEYEEIQKASIATSVLYYSVKFNYPKLFNSFAEIPFVKVKENNEELTLLHLAVKNDRLDFVSKLLTFESYQNCINLPLNDFGSPLYSACYNGNLKIFDLLLEKGANPDGKGYKMSPLIPAAFIGQETFCLELIKRGCDVNTCLIEGTSVLQVAAMQNHVGIMRILIDNGADVCYINNDVTALNFCIDNQSLEGVKLLVENNANVNRQNEELTGYTALHSAAEKGNHDIVEYLLANGADATIKNPRLYTALHVALINNHEEVASTLINNQPQEINGYSLEKSTPILLAALANFPKIVRVLCELNVDVDSTESEFSPLHICCLKSHQECVKILIEFGAKVNRQDASGNSPICFAVNDLQILQLLLDNGANVNFQTPTGVTPLYFAVRNDKIDAVKMLVDNGANILAQKEDGETSMSCAIMQNNEEILKVLLESKIQLDDPYSCELLCKASIYDAPGCLLLLLNHGLAVDSKDYVLGRTSLHYAAMKSLVCVKILLRKSANVNSVDVGNMSPLCYAISLANFEITRELLDNGGDMYTGFGGITALHLAASLGDITSLLLLLSKEIPVDFTAGNDRTALHLAVQGLELEEVMTILESLTLKPIKIDLKFSYNHVDCVKELISRGAHVNSKDSGGLTALHRAVKKIMFPTKFSGDMFTILKVLIENGADVNSTGALHAAAAHGCLELVKFLVENGADVNLRDENGKSPLDLSIENQRSDIVDYLNSLLL